MNRNYHVSIRLLGRRPAVHVWMRGLTIAKEKNRCAQAVLKLQVWGYGAMPDDLFSTIGRSRCRPCCFVALRSRHRRRRQPARRFRPRCRADRAERTSEKVEDCHEEDTDTIAEESPRFWGLLAITEGLGWDPV